MAKPRGRSSPEHRGVSLDRALSKLGALSRAQAAHAIIARRVTVDGLVATNPASRLIPERARIALDGRLLARAPWRAILFHKPRGVLTTSRDPKGRPTIFELLGDAGRGLVAVGRLDFASSGLLLLTNDTRLADWIANPDNAVPRVYVVTVRGCVEEADLERLTSGVDDRGDHLRAHAAVLRKSSSRESHLLVELREGKNREIRRLLSASGHEVTRLKRIKVGELDLGALPAGQWRDVSTDEMAAAFPGAPIRGRTLRKRASAPAARKGPRGGEV